MLRKKTWLPDSKIFTFFKPKNDLFGQFLGPTYFRAEGPIFFNSFFFLKKKYTSCLGPPKAARKKLRFFLFCLATKGSPNFFCPFLQYKQFLQGKKLALSRKIILSRKTIFDPPGGRGFSDLDTLGHYTCPCRCLHIREGGVSDKAPCRQ